MSNLLQCSAAVAEDLSALEQCAQLRHHPWYKSD